MSTISASTTSNTAFKVTSDTTGTLVLQTGAVPTTAISIDASQVVSIGSIAVTGVTTFSAGSAAAPSITTTGDTNTGIYFPAADTIAFTEGGVEAARFDSSGNLGIGTTSPAGKLDIQSASGSGNTVLMRGGTYTNISFATGIRFLQPASTLNANRQFRFTSGDGSLTLQGIDGSGTDTSDTSLVLQPSGGNVGIGTTSPSTILTIGTSSTVNPTVRLNQSQTGGSDTAMYSFGLDNTADFAGMKFDFTDRVTKGLEIFCATGYGYPMSFSTSGASQAMFISSTGGVGIGTTSPSNAQLVVKAASAYTANTYFAARLQAANYADSGGYTTMLGFGVEPSVWSKGAIGFTRTGAYDTGYLAFYSNNTLDSSMVALADERARITSGGDFAVGTTSGDPISGNVTGHVLYGGGAVQHSRNNDNVMFINRKSSDGNLVQFYQDGTIEGSISVSGNTVSYNAFAGSHWSQLQDGGKPDILRGTVMESINELCVWPDEQNERLPKSKVSDTAGSKKVYGVFMAWDNDWTTTNDMYVTAVGAFICRVNASVTVQEGDLLESNGDGTARVQADDIIRSSTIGKVTSTVKTHQYADGSYCVPTVLYCG